MNGQCHKKLSVIDFKCVEDTSQFMKDYIENYNENSNEGNSIFLKVDVQYPENLHKRYNDLPFLPEKMKIEKTEKLV